MGDKLPEWYNPIDWEAYCKSLDEDLRRKQALFWLWFGLLAPITAGMIVFIVLMKYIKGEKQG